MKKIIVVISGSIAAKKNYELFSLLKLKKIEITCVLTQAANKFVNKKNLVKIVGRKIYYEDKFNYDHIELSRTNDAILICPASANIIAKYNQGIADEFALSLLLASNKPLFIAPAMNKEMWNNPSTQNNVRSLLNRGVNFIGPVEGNLACGEIGNGRLAKLETIVENIDIFLKAKKILKNKKIIITNGPTREYIDPVRFITNNSSGKQGYALAKVLNSYGSKVDLVTGPTNINAPHGVNIHQIVTAKEMYKKVKKLMPFDIAICVAAVTDFRNKKILSHKISKKNLKKLSLIQNIDILKEISHLKKNRPKLVIGFSVETKNLKENTKLKLLDKKCDWILACKITKNSPAFESDFNKIFFVSRSKNESWKKISKINIANKLAEKIINFISK